MNNGQCNIESLITNLANESSSNGALGIDQVWIDLPQVGELGFVWVRVILPAFKNLNTEPMTRVKSDTMNTDKYIEGVLYVTKYPKDGKNQVWFSSEELPPFPRGENFKVKAHFEIVPKKSIVLEGVSRNGSLVKEDGGKSMNDYYDWMRANEEKKIRFTVELIDDETRK